MVVVDGLDEWLNLAPLLDLLGAHSSGDLRWVSLDADNESVGEWMGFGAGIVWLDDDDLSLNTAVSWTTLIVSFCVVVAQAK